MTLYVIAGLVVVIIGGVITIFIYGRQSGKNAQRAGDLETIDATQDKQLDVANERRDPQSVAERLRRHEF